MFDKEFLKKAEGKLLEKKERLSKDLARIAKRNKFVKDDYKTNFPEYGRQKEDNAMEISEYGRNIPVEHRLELDLKAVNESLKMIEKGVYGKCKKCKGDIAEKRLLVFPEADICMKCAKAK